MSEAKKLKVISRNGDELFGLCWLEKTFEANVVIMEGMEEHTSRYDAFAKYLNKEGFNVYAIDAFGQGENVKDNMSKVGIWPTNGFARQVKAVDTLVTELQKSTKKPVFIFSHSMGSFMCQDYIERYADHCDRVVLCGSGAKNPAVPAGYLLAKMIVNKKNRDEKAGLLNKLMFGNFNKKIVNPRTAFDWLSVNKENVDKYIADPLCGFGPRNGFCLEFVKGMNQIHKAKNLEKLNPNTNIFIISGSDDPVTGYGTSVKKLTEMYHKYGLNNVQSKIYQGLRHEILNEDRKEEVYKDIVLFFKQGLTK